MSRIILCLVLLAAPSAQASLSNLVSAWGHDFTVGPFEPKEMMVAVATDRASGARFNMIRMPNGHRMAVVPLEAVPGPPRVDPKDLM